MVKIVSPWLTLVASFLETPHKFSKFASQLARTHTHVFTKFTTRIATNDDSPVGRCASASCRSKFNADWP